MEDLGPGRPCLGSSPSLSQSPSHSFSAGLLSPSQHQPSSNPVEWHNMCKAYRVRSETRGSSVGWGLWVWRDFLPLAHWRRGDMEAITLSTMLPEWELFRILLLQHLHLYTIIILICVCVYLCVYVCIGHIMSSLRTGTRLHTWRPHCRAVTICWPTLQKTAELASGVRPKVHLWWRMIWYEKASPTHQTS